MVFFHSPFLLVVPIGTQTDCVTISLTIKVTLSPTAPHHMMQPSFSSSPTLGSLSGKSSVRSVRDASRYPKVCTFFFSSCSWDHCSIVLPPGITRRQERSRLSMSFSLVINRESGQCSLECDDRIFPNGVTHRSLNEWTFGGTKRLNECGEANEENRSSFEPLEMGRYIHCPNCWKSVCVCHSFEGNLLFSFFEVKSVKTGGSSILFISQSGTAGHIFFHPKALAAPLILIKFLTPLSEDDDGQ